MILHKAQEEIAKSNARFKVLNCGRRFGKTIYIIEEIKAKAIYKNSIITYFATTYDHARDIAWEKLKQEFRSLINNKKATTNEQRLELITQNEEKGESIIKLRGWESVEKARGKDFDLIVIDETDSMKNFFCNYQEILRPTLIDRKGEMIFAGTPKGYSNIYELMNMAIEKKAKGYKWDYFHYTSYSNPHIPKEEIDEAREDMTEDRFAQEHLGEFRKMEGLVYREFNRDRHVYNNDKILPEFHKTICGVDFGYTNPASILEIKIDNDNNFYITSEWYKIKQLNQNIIKQALIYNPQEVYPDPAEPDRIEEMSNNGLNTLEVSKDIVAGINKVREYFKQGKIFIHQSCKNLIIELETYRYPERKPDKNEEEKPVKENDHALDALRYALYSYNINQTIGDDIYPEHITDW